MPHKGFPRFCMILHRVRHKQARFYIPWFGRFTSPDPARDQHFEETQSWNIYSYVRNSPIMHTDPTGMLDSGTTGDDGGKPGPVEPAGAPKPRSIAESLDAGANGGESVKKDVQKKVQDAQTKKEEKKKSDKSDDGAIDKALSVVGATADIVEKSVKAGKPVVKAAKIAGPVSDALQTVGDAQKVKDGEMTKTHFGVNLTFTVIGNVPTIPTVIVGNGYSLVESFYGGGRGWKGLGEDLKNSLVSLQQKIASDVKSSLPFLNKNREDEGGNE